MQGTEIVTHSDYIVYVVESGDHGLVSIDRTYPLFVLAFCIFHKRTYIESVVPALQRFKFKHFGHDMVVLHEHKIRKAEGAFKFLFNKDLRNEFMSDLSAIIEAAKTAWFMHVRTAMAQESSDQLSGVCESDESFIGGAMRNMHKWKREQRPQGRGTVGKSIVHGILQRGNGHDALSQVRLNVVKNQKRNTLQYHIKKHVQAGRVVYTDALKSDEGLSSLYVHKMIDHAVTYCEGEVHTNGMENFWSLLKRMLSGTYVAVAPKQLTRYCAEEAFRFNERGAMMPDDSER